MLLQDLRHHRRVLTFRAAADVALSLRALGHPHYPLLSALLPALTKGPLPGAEWLLEAPREGAGVTEVIQIRQLLRLILSVADVYRWAGYTQLPFFDRVAHILKGPNRVCPMHASGDAVGPLQDVTAVLPQREVSQTDPCHTTDAAHKGDPSKASSEASEGPPRVISADGVMRCSPSLLADSLDILSQVSLSDSRAFGALCLQAAVGASLGSAADVTAMAVAAAAGAPRAPETAVLLRSVVADVSRRPSSFSLVQLSQCLSSCSFASLHFPSLVTSLCARVAPHLTLAARTRQRALLTPDAICTLMKDITFFGPPFGASPEGAASDAASDSMGFFTEGRHGDLAGAFIDAAVRYLEDAIDGISPRAAADAVFALSVTAGAPGTTKPLQPTR